MTVDMCSEFIACRLPLEFGRDFDVTLCLLRSIPLCVSHAFLLEHKKSLICREFRLLSNITDYTLERIYFQKFQISDILHCSFSATLTSHKFRLIKQHKLINERFAFFFILSCSVGRVLSDVSTERGIFNSGSSSLISSY